MLTTNKDSIWLIKINSHFCSQERLRSGRKGSEVLWKLLNNRHCAYNFPYFSLVNIHKINLCFTDEETEAQKSLEIAPDPTLVRIKDRLEIPLWGSAKLLFLILRNFILPKQCIAKIVKSGPLLVKGSRELIRGAYGINVTLLCGAMPVSFWPFQHLWVLPS